MRPVVIAGPTASGKSALAVALAERDGGVVINADALQVYACWRVLTARPDAAACARAPHRLYGHVDCAAPYSVGAWLRELEPALAAARAAGARPIIVGGSGLYLDALSRGLAAIPPIPPEIRARSDALIRAGETAALVADLAARDPATLARIDRRNPMRVQRAWDVLTATGVGLTVWQHRPSAPLIAPETADFILLTPDVSNLNNRILRRFLQMIEAGALGECACFRARGGDLDRPSGRALGAAQLIAHLDGACTLEAAITAAVTATRRYAKRQRTWFRNRLTGWRTLDPAAPDPLTTL